MTDGEYSNKLIIGTRQEDTQVASSSKASHSKIRLCLRILEEPPVQDGWLFFVTNMAETQ